MRLYIPRSLTILLLAGIFIMLGKNAAGNGCSGSTFTIRYSPACGCWQVCGNYISDCMTIFSINWNFGDGTTASGSDPCHVYTQPGTYTVTMTVNALCHFWSQTCDIQQTITVTQNQINQMGITPGFSADSLCYGTVQFYDQSINATAWLWDFGDGHTSTQQNPVHHYDSCGTYNVTLTVSDNTCCPQTATASLTLPIFVNCLPVDIDTACLGEPTTFTPQLQNTSHITSWLWEFSDGGTSNVQNPSHVYSSCTANNTVKLTVSTTTGCNDAVIYPVMVNCGISQVNAIIDSVLCYGNSDGAIHLSPVDGVAPYQYQWAHGPTTATITGLAAGNYTVTITDANGCTFSDTYTVYEPGLFTGVITTTDIACHGWATGTALLTMTGGTPPNTFTWSNGFSSSGPWLSSTNQSLPAGTYSVTAIDNNGCSFTASTVINEPPEITATFNVTDASCGVCNGSATVIPSGGTGAYTYQWDANAGNQTTATANNLCAGLYTVTVTDANVAFCHKIFSVAVNNIGAQPLTASATNVTCSNICDGTATAVLAGGCQNPPCNIDWYDANGAWLGLSSLSVNNLCAGDYTVQVTNGLNCVSLATVTVSEPPALNITTNKTDESCVNACDGTAGVSLSGGLPPFSYQWYDGSNNPIPGATGASVSNLCPGNYSVTITDNNGCTYSETFAIIPYQFNVNVSRTNVTCNGACDGQLSAAPWGGTAPFIYQWLDGSNNPVPGRTSRTEYNVCPGTYKVSITDANGCSLISSAVTITEPPVLTLSASATAIPCTPGCTSTGTAVANGGTPPYHFAWYDTSGAQLPGNASTINNLCPGTHSVVVTDANGCSAGPVNFDVIQFFMNVDDSVTNISCNGMSDGAIDLTVTGGSGPYTFFWSPLGQTTEDISGLPAGTYSVTVNNSQGCSATRTFTLTEPPPLSLVVDAKQYVGGWTVRCNGENSGKAYAVPSGGTPPYSFLWDANAGNQTTDTAFQLYAGTYHVTVTDTNGCVVSDSITLNEPPPMNLTSNYKEPSCFGDSTGWIDVTVSGGTPPYFYFWHTSAGVLNMIEDLNNIDTGMYVFAVLDSNGCVLKDTFILNQPPQLVLSETHRDVNCNGGNSGAIDLSVTGGIPPYSFQWNNSQTTEDISALSAGTYTVTVTDDSSCTETLSVTIAEPAPLQLTETHRDVACNGGNTGAIDLSVTGGTPPYSFQWNNSQQTEDISGLSAGTYTVTVTDDSSCQATLSVTIVEPAALQVSAVVQNVGCAGDSTASIVLNVSGGTPPYTYLWDNASTDKDQFALPAGTYNVTVTDDSSCTATLSVTVTEPAPLQLSESHRNVGCNGGNSGAIDLTVTGGTPPYQYLWSNTATTQDISNLTAGSYAVTVSDDSGCVQSLSVTITEPPLLQVTESHIDVDCNGNATGSVNVTVSGGTPPYTYQWSNGATTEDISNLTAGNWVLTVSDDSSCVASITVTITEPPALQLTESHFDIICNGDTSGSIDLTVTGGVPPYQYNWSSSHTTEDIQNIGAGVYTVTVTDDSSCQETLSITVVEPPPIPVTNDQKRICVGDSIFLGGAYQHDPGVYFDTLSSVNNCDSVIRTTLVVDSVLYDTIRVSICDNSTYNFGGNSYNQTGNYYDTLVSTGGCDSIVRLELTVNRTYRDTLQVSICNGESYYAGGANQTTPGYYTDNLTTIFGCDSIVVTHLTVLPTYSFTRDTTICQGQAIFVGGSLQTTPGIYRDTFPTIHGCDSVITTNLDVSVVQIDGYNETICAGTTTTLTPGSGYTSYQWSPGGENTAYITAGPGTYTVVVSNQHGCVDSANYTVLQAPDINLEAVPDSVAIEPGQPVTIALNTNNAASIQSFYWDPEEGLFCPDVANCDEIIVAPEEDTYYMIVATDVWGCKDTTYIIVNVIDLGDVLLYVPNSFSPNGDGNNDEFRVYGRGFKRYRLMIFDRWGEKVFESYDPDEGWDGTFKGEPLNPGVYVYYLDIDFIKNLQPSNYLHDRKGSVTLIK